MFAVQVRLGSVAHTSLSSQHLSPLLSLFSPLSHLIPLPFSPSYFSTQQTRIHTRPQVLAITAALLIFGMAPTTYKTVQEYASVDAADGGSTVVERNVTGNVFGGTPSSLRHTHTQHTAHEQPVKSPPSTWSLLLAVKLLIR
jgi:hypothetical protein